MSTGWTSNQIASALRDFGEDRWDAVLMITAEGEPDDIGVSLITAIGVRESGLKNIVGDSGHGRGWLQIDDRAHGEWLATIPGVRAGTWSQFDGHSAKYPGRVPYVTRATMKAIDILRANRLYAKQCGVPPALRMQVAIAGYNCGVGNSVAAYRRFGSQGIDRYTTGRDYSAAVLDLKGQVASVARDLGWPLG